ncbi:MAG: DUF1810 domain-containing protein [Alphaproteobacteria bacterium]|nr:DUF1810 domain-containing protein [Alphaproteobacteria bacterium]
MVSSSVSPLVADEFSLAFSVLIKEAPNRTAAAELALEEIEAGYKQSCWMWYIFPQHKNLGYSDISKFYGINDLNEANAYLCHPILGMRLRQITSELIKHQDKSIENILGYVDALKLKSSMTLFDFISPNDIFNTVLDIFYNGERDSLTLSYI